MKITKSLLFVAIALVPSSTHAKFGIKSITQAVTHTVKQVGQAAAPVVQAVPSVIAPVTVIGVKVIQGQNPLDAAGGVAKDHIEVLIKPVEIEANTEQKITDALKKNVAPIAPVVDVLRLPSTVQKQATITTGRMAEHIIETGKVGDAIGAPLATAVRQAYANYTASAKPIPDKVRFWLQHVYTPDVLANARYAVDKDFGNIAAILNGISEISGTNHAVTLNNIIVFSIEPDQDDVWWWGHEMQHTVQYKLLGIDGFAARYTLHWNDMENEANAMGDKALTEANSVIRFDVSQHRM